MKVKQAVCPQPEGEWPLQPLQAIEPQLVLVFGAVRFFESPGFFDRLRAAFPGAILAGCSTAGEVVGTALEDGVCTVTAVQFQRVEAAAACALAEAMADSEAAGAAVALALQSSPPAAVLVFGPGVALNGSALLRGMRGVLGEQVPIAGGLAGDGGAFRRTWVMGPDGVSDRLIVAIGLRGEALRFGSGSMGGWTPFGPQRLITRAEGNILYEVNGERALDVYRRYLGDQAAGLPASALLFPVSHQGADGGPSVIRTILGIDEAEGSLTMAGEIEPGGSLRFMQASVERLVNGAEDAAEAARRARGDPEALAILVSCVGRKLVMGDRVDEELEAVADTLGPGVKLTGFYFNGEIGPLTSGGPCALHNQTMTVTTLAEG